MEIEIEAHKRLLDRVTACRTLLENPIAGWLVGQHGIDR